MKYPQTSSLTGQQARANVVGALLSLVIAAAMYFSIPPPAVRSTGMPSVVVNKYFNGGGASGAGDIVELLVIQDALDMRGMFIKDFSSNMGVDNGGKYQFTTNALWSSVRSGTIIVLRNDNSAADTTVGGADYNLDVGMQNTTYFTNAGGTFDIATTEMVMIKTAASGAAGVTGSIHALAGGTAGAQFTATAPPKLIASGTSGANFFVFANNTTESINDFDGTDATGGATGLTFGAGNNAHNTAYINSLRNPGVLTLSINDVTVTEGNSGTTTATFTVSLSATAPIGGVTFDIATQDNTATVADNDYVARNLMGQTISEGNQTFMFDVTVNGDTTAEPNETFFVNVTNVVGATVSDGQGVGAITNDDFTITPVHNVQGSGNTSPLVGQVVTTGGIVTGVKSNGFFIQTPDAQIDADPNTSEGVFVFTSSAPPAAAAVGNSVAVGGTVQEFVPSADVNSPPATEIITPSVTLLSTGNPLPAPITITTAATLVNDINNLERYEGMRVHVDSFTVIAPTQGTVDEPNATSTSNGVFYGVVTGVPRPFREPGVQVPDPLPPGSPCCVPRFDSNPERLRVDSDGLVGAAQLEVTTGATIANVTGPLDYAFRTYTILPDVGTLTQGSVVGNVSATPVPVPTSDEFTVGSFNMERFFDTVNDGETGGAPVLTVTAFNNRLNKASLAIRNILRSPDVLGIEEMENISTLQAVANKVNADAGTPGDYQAYLVEGNDIGGIDVGFLVKSSRVTVIDVTQFGKDTTYIDPGTGNPALLNDRPPLVLRATVANPAGSPFAITVIVNHLRSLSGVDDPTDGNRVRTKRRAQAEYLANLIQARQVADPHERIISVGDYNVFQFNDGYVDSIGTIKGTPTPTNQVVLASSDLVNPDLIDLLSEVTPASQQYSYSFDGDAQVLDHELVSANLLPQLTRIAYARNDADFPESFRNDPNRPERISDHDMAVAYFTESCLFALDRDHQSFAASGGSGTVNVTAITGCAWTASTSSPFITIDSGNIGTGDGVVSYSVVSNGGGTIRSDMLTIGGHSFTVYQGIDFLDVPSNNPFYDDIGKLAARGVTIGCGNGNYCPNDPVTREQMSALILRARGEFSPPDPPNQRFTDVPPQNVFYNFIDRLAVLNITLGCTPDHLFYCPSDPVKREQMSAFIIKGLGEFDPPTPPGQRFTDVPPANVFYNFIDRMAVLNITLGCTPDHLMYCPGDSVTRGQMAAFLVRAFGL
jgi:predicted extracellular nuclease